MYPVATEIMAEATRRCQVLIGREKDARMLFLQHIPPPDRYYLHGGGSMCLSDVESANVEIKKRYG